MIYDLSRKQWGAKAPARSYSTISMSNRPGVEGHHSVGVYGATTPSAFARAVQDDHLNRGWTDGWYNLLCWPDGTLVELRPLRAKSDVRREVTICLAGNYDQRQVTGEQRERILKAYNALIREGAGDHVGWHNQRDQTGCPGTNGVKFFRELPNLSSVSYDEPGDRVLRVRDPIISGNDVTVWQQWLNDWLAVKGHAEISVDGAFGPQTAEATSRFMKDRMGVDTDDPRVGPRTAEKMKRWRDKMADDKGADEPDYVVAVCADNPVDEGMARVIGKTFRWKFLEYPSAVLDYRVGTLVTVGASANRAKSEEQTSWDELVELTGANRDETAERVARAIDHGESDSRTVRF